MDLRERHDGGAGLEHRHPWEISRTKKVLTVFSRHLQKSHQYMKEQKYINIGAGDLYFDQYLLCKFEKDIAYAVDLEYDETVPDYDRVEKHHYMEEVIPEMDYGMMMDSLEYMQDDVDYVKQLSQKIKKNGYLFFTLPSTPAIFSEHDHIVGNLRRYDIREFQNVIAKIPDLEIVEKHYFYICLYLVRKMQLICHISIDKERKVTSHWQYPENHIITRFIVWCLNLDFSVNRLLYKMGIHILGLSLLVVCRKTS